MKDGDPIIARRHFLGAGLAVSGWFMLPAPSRPGPPDSRTTGAPVPLTGASVPLTGAEWKNVRHIAGTFGGEFGSIRPTGVPGR